MFYVTQKIYYLFFSKVFGYCFWNCRTQFQFRTLLNIELKIIVGMPCALHCYEIFGMQSSF